MFCGVCDFSQNPRLIDPLIVPAEDHKHELAYHIILSTYVYFIH